MKIGSSGAIDLGSAPAPADISFSHGIISVNGSSSGTIQLRGANLTLDGGSFLTSRNSGAGPGGDIDLSATQTLQIVNNTFVTTGSLAAGAAGKITLNADHVVLGVQGDADLSSVESIAGAHGQHSGGARPDECTSCGAVRLCRIWFKHIRVGPGCGCRDLRSKSIPEWSGGSHQFNKRDWRSRIIRKAEYPMR